jgi:opacity protein-like surface antigen
MKKSILLTITFLTTLAVSSQAWSDNFQLGVRGGLNFATVAGDDFNSPDGRTSFYAGLVAEAPITERFSIQPEVFYSGQGYDITDEPDQRDAAYQIGYIQVPVIFKVYLLDGLNLHAGPQFGFKVNEEIDFNPNDDSGDIETDAVKNFDVQVTGGVEYKLFASFFVQARYTYGFSEVLDNVDVHNSVFSAGIGYMF